MGTRTHLITWLLVLATAAPVAAISLWSISHTVIELRDPCATWDYPPERPVYVHVGPHDPCRARGVHTESRFHAAIRAALVPGGLFVASLVAIAGAALSRRRLMIAAGIGMFTETLVVFTIAPLTLAAGVSFLLLSKRLLSRP